MSDQKYPNYYKYFKWNNFDPFVLKDKDVILFFKRNKIKDPV